MLRLVLFITLHFCWNSVIKETEWKGVVDDEDSFHLAGFFFFPCLLIVMMDMDCLSFSLLVLSRLSLPSRLFRDNNNNPRKGQVTSRLMSDGGNIGRDRVSHMLFLL